MEVLVFDPIACIVCHLKLYKINQQVVLEPNGFVHQKTWAIIATMFKIKAIEWNTDPAYLHAAQTDVMDQIKII